MVNLRPESRNTRGFFLPLRVLYGFLHGAQTPCGCGWIRERKQNGLAALYGRVRAAQFTAGINATQHGTMSRSSASALDLVVTTKDSDSLRHPL